MTIPTRERACPGQLALIAAGAILAGLNLRLSVASVPPLLAELERHPGLSAPIADVLTALPFLCFAVGALGAPRLVRAFGVESVLKTVLATIAAGTVMRAAGSSVALLVGTSVAAAAAAVGNVVLPVLVKDRFPEHTGLLIALYTSALSVGAALAGGATVPLARWVGWQGALAVWALPALIALVPLLIAGRVHTVRFQVDSRAGIRSLMVDRLAWQVTLFFGLQAAIVFSGLSWLPSILHADGYGPTASGVLLGVYALGGVPASLAVPPAASRIADQRLLAIACAAVEVTALVGLALIPSLAPASVVLFAVGQGASFSLAVSLIALRSPNAPRSADLSGMAQSIGYSIAAAGPLTVGLLHSAVHSWALPLGFLVALCLPMALAGVRAGRAGHVTAGATVRRVRPRARMRHFRCTAGTRQ